MLMLTPKNITEQEISWLTAEKIIE